MFVKLATRLYFTFSSVHMFAVWLPTEMLIALYLCSNFIFTSTYTNPLQWEHEAMPWTTTVDDIALVSYSDAKVVCTYLPNKPKVTWHLSSLFAEYSSFCYHSAQCCFYFYFKQVWVLTPLTSNLMDWLKESQSNTHRGQKKKKIHYCSGRRGTRLEIGSKCQPLHRLSRVHQSFPPIVPSALPVRMWAFTKTLYPPFFIFVCLNHSLQSSLDRHSEPQPLNRKKRHVCSFLLHWLDHCTIQKSWLYNSRQIPKTTHWPIFLLSHFPAAFAMSRWSGGQLTPLCVSSAFKTYSAKVCGSMAAPSDPKVTAAAAYSIPACASPLGAVPNGRYNQNNGSWFVHI